MNKRVRFVSFVLYAICLASIFCNAFTEFKELSWRVYTTLGTLTSSICIIFAVKNLNNSTNQFSKKRKIDNFEEMLTEVLFIACINRIFSLFYCVVILQNLVPSQPLPINQELLDAERAAFPLKHYITALVVAPIREEALFRYLPKKFISNKIVFIIVSSFIFAMIHVFDTPNWFLYLPLYIIPSIYLGYKYWETDNILMNMFIHSVFNL